jgi:hypothetical protein
MKSLIHRLIHRLHWQHGYVVSAWWNDELWIGFRCAECGQVTGAHVIGRWLGDFYVPLQFRG